MVDVRPVFESVSLRCATIFLSSPYFNSHSVEVVLSEEDGRSLSPRMRFIRLLFPALASPKTTRQKQKQKINKKHFHPDVLSKTVCVTGSMSYSFVYSRESRESAF